MTYPEICEPDKHVLSTCFYTGEVDTRCRVCYLDIEGMTLDDKEFEWLKDLNRNTESSFDPSIEEYPTHHGSDQMP